MLCRKCLRSSRAAVYIDSVCDRCRPTPFAEPANPVEVTEDDRIYYSNLNDTLLSAEDCLRVVIARHGVAPDHLLPLWVSRVVPPQYRPGVRYTRALRCVRTTQAGVMNIGGFTKIKWRVLFRDSEQRSLYWDTTEGVSFEPEDGCDYTVRFTVKYVVGDKIYIQRVMHENSPSDDRQPFEGE